MSWADKFNPRLEIEYICDWIRKYFVKNGPKAKAIIGISGGKDSTIAAALLVRALGADRVIGVMMPQFNQIDIIDSREVCQFLGIKSMEIDIGKTCLDLYKAIDDSGGLYHSATGFSGVITNTPCRIRMATLYAIAAMVGGRVVNTCNRSEDYVGYSTKYGDAAGDFSLFRHYCVREVLAIGDALGLPEHLVHKPPYDGVCGKTDEDNLRFSYETLDSFLLDGVKPDEETYQLIVDKHNYNKHKTEAIQLPAPNPAAFSF